VTPPARSICEQVRPTTNGRGEVSLAAALLCLWSSAVALGCGSTPPASRFPTADDALGRMHACYDCALGVQGNAKIDHFSPQGRIKSDVTLTAVVPDRIRFDAEKFGVLVLALASDGERFQMINTQQKEFLYGAATPCNLARLTRVPIPGHALVSLLRGEAPVLKHQAPDAKLEWDKHGYYKIVVSGTNNAEEEIHLEVRDEDFDKPWKDQHVRVRQVRVAQAGIDLYEAELGKFEKVATAKPMVDEDGLDPTIPPIGPVCDAELPHSIDLRVPNTRDEVSFDFADAKWNPPLSEGIFSLVVPGGTHKVHVDCQ
jgi:hypothetical protein